MVLTVTSSGASFLAHNLNNGAVCPGNVHGAEGSPVNVTGHADSTVWLPVI